MHQSVWCYMQASPRTGSNALVFKPSAIFLKLAPAMRPNTFLILFVILWIMLSLAV